MTLMDKCVVFWKIIVHVGILAALLGLQFSPFFYSKVQTAGLPCADGTVRTLFPDEPAFKASRGTNCNDFITTTKALITAEGGGSSYATTWETEFDRAMGLGGTQMTDGGLADECYTRNVYWFSFMGYQKSLAGLNQHSIEIPSDCFLAASQGLVFPAFHNVTTIGSGPSLYTADDKCGDDVDSLARIDTDGSCMIKNIMDSQFADVAIMIWISVGLYAIMTIATLFRPCGKDSDEMGSGVVAFFEFGYFVTFIYLIATAAVATDTLAKDAPDDVPTSTQTASQLNNALFSGVLANDRSGAVTFTDLFLEAAIARTGEFKTATQSIAGIKPFLKGGEDGVMDIPASGNVFQYNALGLVHSSGSMVSWQALLCICILWILIAIQLFYSYKGIWRLQAMDAYQPLNRWGL